MWLTGDSESLVFKNYLPTDPGMFIYEPHLHIPTAFHVNSTAPYLVRQIRQTRVVFTDKFGTLAVKCCRNWLIRPNHPNAQTIPRPGTYACLTLHRCGKYTRPCLLSSMRPDL
jgi:hypothetical protein